MAGSSEKVVYAALAGNALIAITKFIAVGITGSSAMLSEAIHSFVEAESRRHLTQVEAVENGS